MSDSNDTQSITARRFRLLAADGTTYESLEPGRLGGYRPKKIYGRLDCWSAGRHLANGGYVEHRVFFADEPAAIAAGYRPCSHCLPETYKAWKQGGDPGTSEYPWLATPRAQGTAA